MTFLALYGLSRILQVSTQFYTAEGALNPDPDNLVHGYGTPRGDYDGGSWSFGQILPVFLLIAPVLGFIRSIFPSDSAQQPINHSQASPFNIGAYPSNPGENGETVLTLIHRRRFPTLLCRLGRFFQDELFGVHDECGYARFPTRKPQMSQVPG